MKSRLLAALCLCCAVHLRAADGNAPAAPYLLTPPAPATPRINGPDIFGVRPGSPFLYTIPATGDRPMTFSAKNLPAGLKLDSQTGRITGSLPKAMPAPANAKGGYLLSRPAQSSGSYVVTLVAQNALGTAVKKFRIVVGDQIALTPPMGWNSWNCFAGAVSEDRVKSAADAMVKSGLINHGWTYINVDDYWQNHRPPTQPDFDGAVPRRAGQHRAELAFSRHERHGGLHSFARVEGRTLLLARPVDVRRLRRKLAARAAGRADLREVGL